MTPYPLISSCQQQQNPWEKDEPLKINQSLNFAGQWQSWSTLWQFPQEHQYLRLVSVPAQTWGGWSSSSIPVYPECFYFPYNDIKGRCICQLNKAFLFVEKKRENQWSSPVYGETINSVWLLASQYRWGNNNRLWSIQGHSRLGEIGFGWGISVGSQVLCCVLIPFILCVSNNVSSFTQRRGKTPHYGCSAFGLWVSEAWDLLYSPLFEHLIIHIY